MAKNKNLMLLVGLGSIISLACGAAEASKLNIQNSDTKNRDITVQVEKGDGAIVKSDQSVNFILHPNANKDIEVTNKIIEGDTFSVKGSVTMPSMDNRCKDLNLNKNYNIVFSTTNAGGLECTATEAN